MPMVYVEVKGNESIDRALKRFKKAYEYAGTLREVRSRTAFVKPSIKRRNEKLRAIYRQHMAHVNPVT